jgi:hypothetical protein
MIRDAVRWFVVAEAVILIGWALAVLHEAAKFRPPNLYVRLVTASYVALVVVEALRAWVRPHQPFALLLLSAIALTYGIGAMWSMYRHYRYAERLRRHGMKSDELARKLRESAGLPPDD